MGNSEALPTIFLHRIQPLVYGAPLIHPTRASSLLKLYHHEVGTERLLNTLSQGVEEIYLSELAILEFHSAIWKKVRTSEIEIVTAKAVMTCFQTDYTQFQWIQLDSKVIQLGRELLMK